MSEKPDPSSLGEAMRKAAPYLNLGWAFAATVILGTLVGWWLDRKFRSGPWFLLAGILLGIGAAFVNFFRVTMPGQGSGKER